MLLKVEPEQSMQKKKRMIKCEDVNQESIPEGETIFLLWEDGNVAYEFLLTIMRCKLNINCEFYKNTP